MQVKIVAQYDVPENQQAVDETTETGMTEAGFEELHGNLAALGLDDITITRVQA